MGMLSLLIFLALINVVISTCPTGSIEWQTNCYYFEKNQSAFVVAEEYCNSLGGHLASIHDGFTNNFIAQNAGLYFHESTVTDFWVGASDMIVPGNWSWTDGSNFTFTEWNHVKNATGEDCLAQTISDGRWNAQDCFKQKPFVCAVSTIPINPPFIDCGHPWFYFQPTGYCYGGVAGEYVYTWADAETACEKAGKDSHLVSVHTNDELKFLIALSSVEWKWFWTGMYSVDYERTWRWSDKSSVDFFAWQPNFPNLNTSACVTFSSGFMDYDCNSKFQAICKRKP